MSRLCGSRTAQSSCFVFFGFSVFGDLIDIELFFSSFDVTRKFTSFLCIDI